ncbi:beta-lactamase [Devosia riboflavina]|uniref:Beta-lactamase n=2 Tax=Devosia riboflavina TaxID=46914 RepID=A0A087LZJ4_9HYPH|nr:beta-lactamase [Devosia riboflavina]
MFATGYTRTRVGLIKMNFGEDPYDIPVPWYLFRHPKGDVVIDGGIGAEAALDKRGYWGKNVDFFDPILDISETCVEQCKSVGVLAEDVRYVVQSHLHIDHTGAVGRFPNARHIVTRREYDYAYKPDWFMEAAYLRKDFDRPGVDWQLLEDDEADGYDLFGDGSFRMIATPGHSPGHQSFLINLPETGSILLTVDAAYTLDHWNDLALPGLSSSASQAVASVHKLRQIAKKNQALVVTGHDPEAWRELRHGPAQYYS